MVAEKIFMLAELAREDACKQRCDTAARAASDWVLVDADERAEPADAVLRSRARGNGNI